MAKGGPGSISHSWESGGMRNGWQENSVQAYTNWDLRRNRIKNRTGSSERKMRKHTKVLEKTRGGLLPRDTATKRQGFLPESGRDIMDR